MALSKSSLAPMDSGHAIRPPIDEANGIHNTEQNRQTSHTSLYHGVFKSIVTLWKNCRGECNSEVTNSRLRFSRHAGCHHGHPNHTQHRERVSRWFAPAPLPPLLAKGSIIGFVCARHIFPLSFHPFRLRACKSETASRPGSRGRSPHPGRQRRNTRKPLLRG